MAYLKNYDPLILETIQAGFDIAQNEDGDYTFIRREGLTPATEKAALNTLNSIAEVTQGENNFDFHGVNEDATKILNDLAAQIDDQQDAHEREILKDIFNINIQGGHITFEPLSQTVDASRLAEAQEILERRGLELIPDGVN